MGHMRCFLLMQAGSLIYFAFSRNTETFAASFWFGGIALLLHWLASFDHQPRKD